jgi:citrate synthase
MAQAGLEGVVAAETRLSDVDGENGRLVIAGHDVEGLAPRIRFEGACGLLWGGALPEPAAEERLRAELAEGRCAAFERLPALGDALSTSDGMEALRASLAHLRGSAPAGLVGAVAVFTAAWIRARRGETPVPPDRGASHAEDFLRMSRGRAPGPSEVRALDTYWVTVCDHGMNASTFAARVVVSTGSDDVSAVVAALGALKGPLHGGAPGPVLDMLDGIGRAERANAWLESELAAGRRIMGMGHRIYRTRDPRAAVLEKAVEAFASAEGTAPRLALARAVERAAEGALRARHPERPLQANVEFYTALLLDAVGLGREAFTPAFAASRVAGWLAHAREQRDTGRLIRPASRYVGPPPAQP